MKRAALALIAVAAAGPALAHGGLVHGDLAGVAASPLAFLALGLLVGMGHALEADHMAAVATMMDSAESRRSVIARGAVWGAGHTLALFAICSAVVLFGLTISGRVEAALEAAVGVMIAALGLRVLWRLRRSRVHIHVHSHGGIPHIHAHSHAGESVPHDAVRHAHPHPQPARRHARALGIGVMHGAAGSAGLMVLTVAATDSTAQAFLFFLAFGLGTILGMTLISAVASYPLGLIQRGAGWMRAATSAVIGGIAVLIGGSLAAQSWQAFQVAGL